MNNTNDSIVIKEENCDERRNILSCKFGCLNEVVPYFSKKEVRYISIPMVVYEYRKHSYKKEFFCSRCHKRVKISVGSSKSSLSRYKTIIGLFFSIFILDLVINFNNIDQMRLSLTQTAIVLFIFMFFSLLIAFFDNIALHNSIRSYKISLKTEGHRDVEQYHIFMSMRRYTEKEYSKIH